MVSPILILLTIGIFEFGFILRNSNVLANSLRSAARTGSQAKNSPSADLLTLQTFMASAGKLKNATVVKVIVYRSTVANGAPPASCLTASTSGSPPHGVSTGGVNCSVYMPADLTPASLVTGNFNCMLSPGWDSNWCPSTRLATDPATLEYVGVYAEITYSGITGLLPGKTMTIKDKAVNRIEPIV